MAYDYMSLLFPGALGASQALQQWPYGPNPLLAFLGTANQAGQQRQEEEERRRQLEEERARRERAEQLQLIQLASSIDDPAMARAVAELFPDDPTFAGLEGQIVGRQAMQQAEEERRLAELARALDITPEDFMGRLAGEGPPTPEQFRVEGQISRVLESGEPDALQILLATQREGQELQRRADETAEERAYRERLAQQEVALRQSELAQRHANALDLATRQAGLRPASSTTDPDINVNRDLDKLRKARTVFEEQQIAIYEARGGERAMGMGDSYIPLDLEKWKAAGDAARQIPVGEGTLGDLIPTAAALPADLKSYIDAVVQDPGEKVLAAAMAQQAMERNIPVEAIKAAIKEEHGQKPAPASVAEPVGAAGLPLPPRVETRPAYGLTGRLQAAPDWMDPQRYLRSMQEAWNLISRGGG